MEARYRANLTAFRPHGGEPGFEVELRPATRQEAGDEAVVPRAMAAMAVVPRAAKWRRLRENRPRAAERRGRATNRVSTWRRPGTAGVISDYTPVLELGQNRFEGIG